CVRDGFGSGLDHW
nr:immunoglobulin heavy chain junction region [Macaca mulatta]